ARAASQPCDPSADPCIAQADTDPLILQSFEPPGDGPTTPRTRSLWRRWSRHAAAHATVAPMSRHESRLARPWPVLLLLALSLLLAACGGAEAPDGDGNDPPGGAAACRHRLEGDVTFGTTLE